ncbi:hypothetical protein FGIG_01157 [Fasciola gigantica]|uniref:Uncharacterized protein n=1 Tax=Fasciola gigantica TaxID=46835 RepID=A0A504YK46_FASGI|nr:hypothetical protein FGIG_01157 [Fasciola gigantica]
MAPGSSRKRRLILHFDARNTLFVADMRFRLPIEEALNSYITGLIWGIEDVESHEKNENNSIQNGLEKTSHTIPTEPCRPNKQQILEEIDRNKDVNRTDGGSPVRLTGTLDSFHDDDVGHQHNHLQNGKNGCLHPRNPYTGERFQDLTKEELHACRHRLNSWKCLPESPCIRQPRPDAVSLYKLLEQQIVRQPADRGRLRKYLGNFTQTPEGQQFLHLFQNHLEKLRWPDVNSTAHDTDEMYIAPVSKLSVIGLDNQRYHYLMPAFYRLMSWLMHTGRQFAIVLRTYGQDGSHIVSAIETYLQGHHPTEKPNPSVAESLVLDQAHWRLKRDTKPPQFTLCKCDAQTCDGSGECVSGEQAIHQTWSNWNGVVSVQDDFVYWQSNHYDHRAAKPMWFNPKDREVQHVFFDDNIRFDEDKTNGIDLIQLDTKDVNEMNSQSYRPTQSEAAQWENVYFVQADLLQIINNPCYFVEKITECEHNLDVIQGNV